MNILFLAAGADQNESEDGYPLCLAEFDGIPLIQRLAQEISDLNSKAMIVAFREEDVRRHHLDQVAQLIHPSAKIIRVQSPTQGAACTALLATEWVDNDEELLIINANEVLDIDFSKVISDFRSRGIDAGVVVFPSIHPRYSYVRVDDAGNVVEAAEKRPISRNATAGFYWFRKGKDFVQGAKDMVRKDARVNDKFYICPTFNELVLKGRRIGVFPIDKSAYHPLKNSRQVEHYEMTAKREFS